MGCTAGEGGGSEGEGESGGGVRGRERGRAKTLDAPLPHSRPVPLEVIRTHAIVLQCDSDDSVQRLTVNAAEYRSGKLGLTSTRPGDR